MNQSGRTWVLVGDSSRARILKFNGRADSWTLLETIAGDGSGAPDATRDFGKKASEHKGALHGHGNIENSGKETAERRFAHLLAHVLERGHSDNAFMQLILVAEPKLLGELRENLSRNLKATVIAEINKDYGHFGTAELREKVMPMLPAELALPA